MDITDVKLFLSIAETANITKAADMMHFSQSTISYRLKKLEKELGVELFYRTKGNRAVELTMQGEYFIQIAKQWLSVWENTHALQFLPSHFLTVAAIDSISTSLLPDAYRAASEGEHHLKLRIMTHQSGEIYDLVEKQIADIGFVSVPQQRREVVTKLAFLQRYYVVRYSRHPTALRRLRPDQLDPQFEIFQDWGGSFRQLHEELWGPLTTYHVWVDTVSLLQSFLTDERYWAILPEASLQRLVESFRSVQIDELDIPDDHQRRCYIIKHKAPKVSVQESLHVFETIVDELLARLDIQRIEPQ